MEKWTTIKFITKFFDNTLGRKRVHGTYRILEGDYCKLLVRATVQSGVPDGNELIAIDLSDNDNRVVFWKNGYSHSFTYRMSRTLDNDVNNYQVLPEMILTGEEENILNSGIVDISPTHALIEIGDKPFLLHRNMENTHTTTKKRTYTHANQVSKRVASIREALNEVKDPIGDRQICQEWWAREMPPGFVPPEFDPELVKVLSIALNPLDYGFKIDECTIGVLSGQGYGIPALRSFVPKKKLMLAKPQTARVQKWMEALAKWTDAADKLLGRSPPIYKGLSVHSSKYSSVVRDDDRKGTIIVTTAGVFITGEVHSGSNWVKNTILTQWYKLTRAANQINIPPCT